jgi:hypothetical protein
LPSELRTVGVSPAHAHRCLAVGNRLPESQPVRSDTNAPTSGTLTLRRAERNAGGRTGQTVSPGRVGREGKPIAELECAKQETG